MNCIGKEEAILIIEPFYGGSHKQLVDLLSDNLKGCAVFTLPAKKWHWRMRTSALYFAQNIPKKHSFRVIFASSVLNLSDLVSLRPDLANIYKILYFHENQLVYPVRKQKDRDFYYGYTQIISSLVADTVIFNSNFNMMSFLNSINSFLTLMPDFRPKGVLDTIKGKSKILYFPVKLIDETVLNKNDYGETNLNSHDQNTAPLHIVWPHRWEHDKDPEMFFNTLFQLSELEVPFQLSVIGQTYQDIPDIFSTAKEKLSKFIVYWGYQENREEFLNVLYQADVVVSTAKHEFFGVAMLEAVCCKCFPFCPNSLVYPEIFPEQCLYNTPRQLFKKLKQFVMNPRLARQSKIEIDIKKFSWSALQKQYEDLFHLPSTEGDG